MALSRDQIELLIFQGPANLLRYTQDSPIYPDVWLEYVFKEPDKRVDLLLTPHEQHRAAEVASVLRERLRDKVTGLQEGDSKLLPWRLASTGGFIAAELSFDELLGMVLPMTKWWPKIRWTDTEKPTSELLWLRQVAGAVRYSQLYKGKNDLPNIQDLVESGVLENVFDDLLKILTSRDLKSPQAPRCLWSVSLNRKAYCGIAKSVPATKADASRRLFDIDGKGICWAVIDTGIDKTHSAFRRSGFKGSATALDPSSVEINNTRPQVPTRIVATYDFTRLRDLMSHVESQAAVKGATKKALSAKVQKKLQGTTTREGNRPLSKKQIADLVRDLERAIKKGRTLDWSAISPLLRVPHTKKGYEPPKHPHGTHVAGILGASETTLGGSDGPVLVGMCPGIDIYDLRVMGKDGTGDEFCILAALQFVRFLNAKSDHMVIHGVNLSLSMDHNVANFACGQTPVCKECERNVAEGTVVVAAAGNQGQSVYQTRDGRSTEGFRGTSITDPGNAEAVITVGATHRFKPHMYGVSYFSSRGPTGDGRIKPDLLAPGEKIKSMVPGEGIKRLDGTSMAAPHVSGAAALLLAQYPELIGRPQRVKEILCKTATDLRRERYFQGHGMVDVLRALQSM